MQKKNRINRVAHFRENYIENLQIKCNSIIKRYEKINKHYNISVDVWQPFMQKKNQNP